MQTASVSGQLTSQALMILPTGIPSCTLPSQSLPGDEIKKPPIAAILLAAHIATVTGAWGALPIHSTATVVDGDTIKIHGERQSA